MYLFCTSFFRPVSSLERPDPGNDGTNAAQMRMIFSMWKLLAFPGMSKCGLEVVAICSMIKSQKFTEIPCSLAFEDSIDADLLDCIGIVIDDERSPGMRREMFYEIGGTLILMIATSYQKLRRPLRIEINVQEVVRIVARRLAADGYK